MTYTIPAVGGQSLTGFLPEQRSDKYVAGHPCPFIQVTAAPAAAPTTALITGAASKTGSVVYSAAYKCKTGKTIQSADSIAATPVAQDVTVTAATPPADTEIEHVILYRADNGGGKRRVHTYYDPAGSMVWTDTFLIDDPLLNNLDTPVTVNETGGNGGALFSALASFEGEIDAKKLVIAQLTGTVLSPAKYPGPIQIPAGYKHALESGLTVPTLAAILGEPVETMTADGIWVYDWVPSVSIRKPRTLSIVHYPGGTVRPIWLFGIAVSGLEWDVKGGAVASSSVKAMGTHFNLCGIGKAIGTANPDYPYAPVMLGFRQDADAVTKVLRAKVVTVNSDHLIWKVVRGTTPGTYGATTFLTYFDATSKKQTKYAAQVSDRVRVVDSNGGEELGPDTWNSMYPFTIIVPGPLDQLNVDDIFEYQADGDTLIPGAGSTPGTPGTEFTGIPARAVNHPNFSAAHLQFLRGTSAATDALDFQEGKFQLDWGMDPTINVGPESMTTNQFTRKGNLSFKASLVRELIDREFQIAQLKGTNYVSVFRFQGEKPITQPGTRSTYRELIQVSVSQLSVNDTKAPTASSDTTKETLTFEAEQLQDGSDSITIKVQTPIRTVFR